VSEDGFDKLYMLKILTEANKFEEVALSDNILINGGKYRKAESAFGNIPTNGDYGIKQIIRYSLNNDGEINELMTASYNAWIGDNPENKGFQQLYERTESKRYVRGRLGSRAALSSNSLVFFLPYGTNEFEEKDCIVSNYNILTDDLIYPSNAYIFSRDGIMVDAAVVFYENEQLIKNRLYVKPIIMVEDYKYMGLVFSSKSGKTLTAEQVKSAVSFSALTTTPTDITSSFGTIVQYQITQTGLGVQKTDRSSFNTPVNIPSKNPIYVTLPRAKSYQWSTRDGNAADNLSNNNYWFAPGCAFKPNDAYMMMSFSIAGKGYDNTGTSSYGNITAEELETAKAAGSLAVYEITDTDAVTSVLASGYTR